MTVDWSKQNKPAQQYLGCILKADVAIVFRYNTEEQKDLGVRTEQIPMWIMSLPLPSFPLVTTESPQSRSESDQSQGL